MVKDDYFVITYRILTYLYECFKILKWRRLKIC